MQSATLPASTSSSSTATLIGSGTYGLVGASVNPKTGEPIAVKKIRPEVLDELSDTKHIFREIKLLRMLKGHPNIVPLETLTTPDTSPTNLKNVFEIFTKYDTDLSQILKSTQLITEDHVQWFLYQILCGINFVHSANIIHRDIKPANIFLNKNCDTVIGDFGLARAIQPTWEYTTKAPKLTRQLSYEAVTLWYRAPEILLYDSYGPPVDMWSIGCILAELLMMQTNKPGRAPLFRGDEHNQLHVIFDVIGTPDLEDMGHLKSLCPKPRKDFRQLIPNVNPSAIDLLEKLLTFNPAKRITAHAALRHDYLKAMHDPTMNLAFPLHPSWKNSHTSAQEDEKSLLEYYEHEEMIDHHSSKSQLEERYKLISLKQHIFAEIQSYGRVKQLNESTSASVPTTTFFQPTAAAATQEPQVANTKPASAATSPSHKK